MIKFLLPLFVCCSLHAQIVIRSATLRGATVGTTNAVSAPAACTPSYSNPGGTNNRVAILSMTSSQGAYEIMQNTPNTLITNAFNANVNFFRGTVGDGVNTYLIVNAISKTPITIDEATYIQSDGTGGTEGTWQYRVSNDTNGWVVGSNDNSIWTNIGGTFTLNPSSQPTNVLTTLHGNTAAYVYYQQLLVSGTLNNSPFVHQIQYRICPGL